MKTSAIAALSTVAAALVTVVALAACGDSVGAYCDYTDCNAATDAGADAVADADADADAD